MLFLVLGKGKTGSLVAEVARERGHGVRALDIDDNRNASALTAPTLAGVDVVIDFTAPEAAAENIRAVLALGGRIVVGTTGWYQHLDEMKSKAQNGGALLYGTNFSIGVQKLFQLTAELAKLDGYQFSIDETHHVTKLDAPSGTAITLKEIILGVQPEIPVYGQLPTFAITLTPASSGTGPTGTVQILSSQTGLTPLCTLHPSAVLTLAAWGSVHRRPSCWWPRTT